LKATHALSHYRLVLKQGEPFSPVVLRVHSDPISIIAKVLEQNPKSYTKIQDFLEVGANMVRAGLYASKTRKSDTDDQQSTLLFMSEKRVTSMCIEAALREDDFETAYSYVASRLATTAQLPTTSDLASKSPAPVDDWSWRAALQAGQYIRTAQTIQPTHLGTASGNLDIRHLEQRVECLATALRIAPSSQLHEILKTFRRCEEQLDSAIKEEAAKEAAWDAAGDLHSPGIPGAFTPGTTESRSVPPSASTSREADDVPMSLFDLSRATARVAQRNLSVLSSLGSSSGGQEPEPEPTHKDDHRTRKRDQLRDAAMGTLVSGVGWLINAPANRTDG